MADRGSAIYAAYDARSREEAMDYETEHSASGKDDYEMALQQNCDTMTISLHQC